MWQAKTANDVKSISVSRAHHQKVGGRAVKAEKKN